MQFRALAASVGLVLALALTACQSAGADGAKKSSGTPGGSPAVPSAPAVTGPPPPPPSVSGLPPVPDAESRERYLAALDTIDPRIVGDDPVRAVERGRTTCQSIAAHMNHAKLISQTKTKFTRAGYVVTTAHAEAIVRAANTHLCPSYGA